MIRRQLLSAVLAGCCGAVLLSGCEDRKPEESDRAGTAGSIAAAESGDSAASADESAGDLQYSGDILVWTEENLVDITTEQISSFKAQYPGLSKADFTVEAVDEEDAADRMAADSDGGADIFTFYQDEVKRLCSAGILKEIPSDYAEMVRDGNDQGSVEAASVAGTLYAYPISSDGGYLLYYDSGVVTDPSDLNRILSDCESAGKKFCMEITSGWYQPSFFFGTGCNLSYDTDAEGKFTSADVDYASEKGMTALKEMIHLASSGAFQNSSSASDGGDTAAIIDGTWDASALRERFGENYACAKLPSFQGEDGQSYQMSGFSSHRLLGVKPQGDEEREAVCEALAFYLSDEDVQLARYQAVGMGPSNLEAQASSDVRENEALTALNKQMSYDRPQGLYPADYWTMAMSLGDDVMTGTLTADSSNEDLMAALQSFQDACLSYVEE